LRSIRIDFLIFLRSEGRFIKVSLKGRSPFKTDTSPSCEEDIPTMERGIKGVG
jgi:hypothetical protein